MVDEGKQILAGGEIVTGTQEEEAENTALCDESYVCPIRDVIGQILNGTLSSSSVTLRIQDIQPQPGVEKRIGRVVCAEVTGPEGVTVTIERGIGKIRNNSNDDSE